MLKFILATLFGVLLAGCGKTDPAPRTEFVVKGQKITVRGNLNSGATVTADQAESAVNMAIKLLEHR